MFSNMAAPEQDETSTVDRGDERVKDFPPE
jgi:hypothetical protein